MEEVDGDMSFRAKIMGDLDSDDDDDDYEYNHSVCSMLTVKVLCFVKFLI